MYNYKITFKSYMGNINIEYISANSENEARYFFEVARPLSDILEVEWMGE